MVTLCGDGESHIGPILREGRFIFTLGYDHRSTLLITRVPYFRECLFLMGFSLLSVRLGMGAVPPLPVSRGWECSPPPIPSACLRLRNFIESLVRQQAEKGLPILPPDP